MTAFLQKLQTTSAFIWFFGFVTAQISISSLGVDAVLSCTRDVIRIRALKACDTGFSRQCSWVRWFLAVIEKLASELCVVIRRVSL